MNRQEPPKGAAIFMLDDYILEEMLGLPPGVYLHHAFPMSAEWGKGVGLVLWTDEEGLLPPVEHFKRYEDLTMKVKVERFQTEDGRYYCRLIFPRKEGAIDGE
jgi:hypothetical protein